jgi:hypothetical protein
MQEDFFVGFDNDMDEFQNIVGKIKQRNADLKQATGAKTNIGARLKRTLKPLSTIKNMKQIRDTRKAGGMTPDVPTDTPTDTPIEETMVGAMTPDMVADMGSVSGDTKSSSGGTTGSGLSTGAKIGIGVGALVVIGTIIFFVARKK